jgi:hypothetical protein
MNAAVGFLLVCIILLGAVTCRAEGGGPDRSLSPPFRQDLPAGRMRQPTPGYYDEQLLNYRYSEVCVIPLPRSQALPEALQEAVKLDAATWMPWVIWWNALQEQRKKAGCGDA